jgi:TATA-binding protein-associated factor
LWHLCCRSRQALRRLHRQVLPFCLRRTKETVLSELPPKIIEDRICDLHPLQRRLYTAFAQSQARQGVTATIEAAESSEQPVVAGAKHVFAALQHLRKLCNHPLLAIGPTHHLRAEYETAAQAEPDGLHSLAFSPKLLALQQILLDCGIGAEVGGAALSLEDCPTTGSVAVHRALVFCQSREMLDLVANDLLSRCMPTVSYLRLDGRVPASQRFELVTQFNSDPSLDVMLLTTSVGGLGLNLTSADVVIFVDHDWNPMKDLQAMDRAHRIGQQRVVSVFRLITRDTLEEKIMGLQQFKLHIAHSVVNDQNAALDTMGTEQLLELFDVSPATAAAPPSEHATPSDANGSAIASTFASGGGVAASSRRKSPGLQAMLDEVGELWGDEQYLEEYDLQNFLRVQGM